MMDELFLLGRILFGGYFFLQGINHFKNANSLAGYAAAKGVPSPKLATYASGFLLLLGGAGVVLGAYYIYALWLIAIFLVPVTLMMHAFWKAPTPEARVSDKINFEKNVALLGAALMLATMSSTWATVFEL